jgi:hypothetical protein
MAVFVDHAHSALCLGQRCQLQCHLAGASFPVGRCARSDTKVVWAALVVAFQAQLVIGGGIILWWASDAYAGMHRTCTWSALQNWELVVRLVLHHGLCSCGDGRAVFTS